MRDDTNYLDIPWFLRQNPEEARKEMNELEQLKRRIDESGPDGIETAIIRDDLLSAVQRFHAAWVACQECPKMLLSSGCDEEPKRLMEELHKARDAMFKLACR